MIDVFCSLSLTNLTAQKLEITEDMFAIVHFKHAFLYHFEPKLNYYA